MTSRPWIAAALAFALGSVPAARADAAPRDPVSEVAAQAERDFDAERWAEAAVALHRVAGGETGDPAEERKLAEHHLGIALYELGFPHASLEVFHRIAGDPHHPAFEKALLWLARLSAALPEPAGVAGVVAGYSWEEIGRYDNAWQRDTASRLRWLSGRALFRERRWNEAADALAAVRPASPDFGRAQLFLGVAYAEQGRTAPAALAFQHVIATPARSGEPDDVRALAQLSLGRLTMASPADGRLAGAAMRSLAAVDPRSEHWLDAQLELGRALFLAGDPVAALGKAIEVEQPFAPRYAYPEAALLRASVYHALCHDQDATAVAGRFVAVHEPVARDLRALLDRFPERGAEPALHDFLVRVRSVKTTLAPATRDLVESVLSDRETLRHLDYVRFVDQELARLRKAPAALRESALGAAIEAATTRARERAVHEAGAITRRRLERARTELDDRLRRARSVVSASAPAGGATAAGPPARRLQSLDEFGETWRLDDETWRDEPGRYWERIDARCTPGEAKVRRGRAIGWMRPSPGSGL